MTDLITAEAAPDTAALSNVERLRAQLVACLAELSADELAFALTEGQQRTAISPALA